MKSILVIAQKVVLVEVFNNLLANYIFKEFADDTNKANGSIL